MTTLFTRIWSQIVPIIAMLAFCAIFIVGLALSFYVLIFLAIIGLALFGIGYLRVKFLMRRAQRQHSSQEYSGNIYQGRTIDHEADAQNK